MKIYLIAFKLNVHGEHHAQLLATIKALSNNVWWQGLLDAVWLIRTEHTAIEIKDALKPFIDPESEVDRGLLVVHLSGEAAWDSIDFEDWLEKYLNQRLY